MMVKLTGLVLTGFLLSTSGFSFAETISHKQVSDNKFQLTLKDESAREVENAQLSLYPLAVQLCGTRSPTFGKYTFNKSEPLLNETGKSSFVLIQDIECGKQMHAGQEPTANNLSNSDEMAMRYQTRQLTEDYFSSIEANNFEKAYSFLGIEMKSYAEYPAWKQRESNRYGESLGKLLTRQYSKITLYNNPANSPKPGIYVAVDYESNYENLPIECGYVIWHTTNVKPPVFTIMRTDSGRVTKDIFAEVSKDDLLSIRSQIGCRANSN